MRVPSRIAGLIAAQIQAQRARLRLAAAGGAVVSVAAVCLLGLSGWFITGAAFAGLAGAVAGGFYTTNPNMALELGVMVFVVVVVGGLGSLGGAMLASLLIGVITSLAVGIDRSLADLFALVGAGDWARGVGGLMTLKVSSLSATIPFALMLLILLVRPSGLMGEKN